MSRFFKPSLAMVLLSMSGLAAAQHQLPGRVLRVIDGDSLVLDVRGSQHEVGLAGVDAPELNQPWGPAAANRLKHTLAGAFVVVTQVDSGIDRRPIGTVVFKDRDVALDLLNDGLAWSTIPVEADDRTVSHPYTAAERRARQERRGLWSQERPLPPWEWRRGPALP